MCAVFVIAVGVFWRTAYPTITWWDSSGYSLAAATLGIIAPPGSLLLTLLGWPVAHLPVASPAHALNMFAGALAGIALVLLLIAAQRMRRIAEPSLDTATFTATSTAATIGTAFGALTFAFSITFWEYAIRFTPYVLTIVFTGLILLALVRWWERADQPESWQLLALTGLLFGLDFSVHRTNALLVPGAIVWVLMRDPQIHAKPRAVAGAMLGLVVGILVQLLVIPIAATTHSPVNFFNPSSFSRFWDYVSLRHLGGNFLLGVLPRKSPFWSAQVWDFVRVVASNFCNVSGPLGVLGVLPGVTVVAGLVTIWRRNTKLATAFAAMVALQAAATVIYFNIPANFFRTFDRHYLPVCATLACLGMIGLGHAAEWAVALLRSGRTAPLVAGAVAAVVPLAQLRTNWTARDASQQYFARDFATNILSGLPPHAILFTAGDNDTYPLLYAHAVEGLRPDVSVVNLSVSTMPSFRDVMRRMDPSFPQRLTDAERLALLSRHADTTFVVPVHESPETLGLEAGDSVPDSVSFRVKRTYGENISPNDVSLFEVMTANRWKRPVAFAITGTKNSMAWLAEYGRAEGLYWRVMPVPAPATNIELIRRNLIEHIQLRGFAGATPILDPESRSTAVNYYSALELLLQAEHARGDDVRCRADARTFTTAIPAARLGVELGLDRIGERVCGDRR